MIRAASRHVSRAHPATLPPRASLASPPRFAPLKRGGGALAWLTPLPLACSWRIGHHYGQPCGHSAAPPPSAGGALRRPLICPTPTTTPASLAPPPRFATLTRGGGALAWLTPLPLACSWGTQSPTRAIISLSAITIYYRRGFTPLPLACSWRKGRHYGQPCGHSAAPPPSAGGAPTQAAQLPYPDHHPRFASTPAPFRFALMGRGCARKASRPCPLLARGAKAATTGKRADTPQPRHLRQAVPSAVRPLALPRPPPRASLAPPPRFASLTRGGGALARLHALVPCLLFLA